MQTSSWHEYDHHPHTNKPDHIQQHSLHQPVNCEMKRSAKEQIFFIYNHKCKILELYL